jgi:hypothetical protein
LKLVLALSHSLSLVFQFFVAKTISCVVIDQARRLHKSVADGATNKFETPFLEILGHGITNVSGSGHVFRVFTFAIESFAVGE